MLRLFGAQSTAVGKTVENFPPQWRAAAQWKSRGAETLVALQAQSPSGLKKAAQALRQAFSADLYGAGETTLPAAVVEALERHDKLAHLRGCCRRCPAGSPAREPARGREGL